MRPEPKDRRLQLGDVCITDGGAALCRHVVLPLLVFARRLRPDVADARTHVTMEELEPRPCECIGQLAGVLVIALRDLEVGRVGDHRHISCRHGRRRLGCTVLNGGHHEAVIDLARLPLIGAGWRLHELPLVAEQRFEVHVVPYGGGGRPCALQPGGDGIGTDARPMRVGPAETLLCEVGTLRLSADSVGGTIAVHLAEGVATDGQRHGFLVVHGHTGERLADVLGRSEGIGDAVRALGVHVDEPHLYRTEGIGQLTVSGVTLIAEPLGFRTPVDVVLRRPHVSPAEGEAERGESHRLEGAVAGEHKKVGPGDGLPVLLLDREKQTASLVEVAIVWPGVEWSEALRPGAAAATAVMNAVGAGCVPAHANEQTAVVAPVGRPPILGVGHDRVDVAGEFIEVDPGHRLRVVEVGAEGTRGLMVLVEDP